MIPRNMPRLSSSRLNGFKLYNIALHAFSFCRLYTSPRASKMGSIPETVPPVRVFIAGGSYAGLSVALNLLDLGQGLSPRLARESYTHHPDVPRLDFQITIADERDGFCAYPSQYTPPAHTRLTPRIQYTSSALLWPSPIQTTPRRHGSSSRTSLRCRNTRAS